MPCALIVICPGRLTALKGRGRAVSMAARDGVMRYVTGAWSAELPIR